MTNSNPLTEEKTAGRAPEGGEGETPNGYTTTAESGHVAGKMPGERTRVRQLEKMAQRRASRCVNAGELPGAQRRQIKRSLPGMFRLGGKVAVIRLRNARHAARSAIRWDGLTRGRARTPLMPVMRFQ